MKSCYEDLIRTSEKVPTVYIRGNHDYKIKVPELNIVDNYLQEGIYYTHGWEFDVEQCIGSPLYSWIVKYFPSIYQKLFRSPFETISEHNVYTEQVIMIQAAAAHFAEKKGYEYLVFGHTHFPRMKGKLVNCGDFVDSGSYVVIEDGKPELKRMV